MKKNKKFLIKLQKIINNFMNYLTNYYKNLCEQLQEKVNLLEAQIYGPEGKYILGSQKYPRDFSALGQGDKRKRNLEALKAALTDENHPIHQNPEHVSHVQRVVADIERLATKNPGDPTFSELAQHAVGEKEAALEPGYLEFGWAKDRPGVGRATAKHMRTAVDVMTGRYGKNKPTTGSQQY